MIILIIVENIQCVPIFHTLELIVNGKMDVI